MEEQLEETKSELLTDRIAEILAYIFVTVIMVGLAVTILFF